MNWSSQLGDFRSQDFVNNALSPYAPWRQGSSGPILDAALTAWRVGGTRGKTAIFVGDSTFATAGGGSPGDMTARMNTLYGGAGQQVPNLNLDNRGISGARLSEFMADTVVWGITWLLAQSFDLVVMSYGINDVRDGSTSAAQISTMLTNFVNAVVAAKPNANIILVTPNSFLSVGTDVTGVTPQVATDRLWGGYDAVKAINPAKVAAIDLQTLYFGRTCVASSPDMFDQLHPSQTLAMGYNKTALAISNKMIPRGWPYNVAQSTTTDLFWPEVVLLVRGTSIVDSKGRHILIPAAGTGVVGSSDGLVYSGANGLVMNDNQTDWDFGPDGTNMRGCIEVAITPTVRAVAQGQRLLANSAWDVSLGASPNNEATVAGISAGNVTLGVKTNLCFEFSRDMTSGYRNGVSQNFAFNSINWNGGGPMYMGQATDAWAAVFYQGTFQARLTKEVRYNHGPGYVVPDWNNIATA